MTARRTPPSDDFARAVGDAKPLPRGPERVRARKAPAAPAGAGAQERERERTTRSRAAAGGASDAFAREDADDPRLARRASVKARTFARLRSGALAPTREVDLHGLRAAAARERVRREVAAAAAAGQAVVRIVHGRGRRGGGFAVLRAELPEWLEALPRVLAFAPSPGGEAQADGALVVLVRTGD